MRIDFLLKYKNKRLIWTVYSLGIIQRYDEGNVYFPHFDRRHNVNFVSGTHLVIIIVGKADAVGILDQFPFHTDSRVLRKHTFYWENQY